jgi:membrane protease YdiL (CAAX protease family)
LESTILPALTLLIFTGIVEELAFRGVMQRAANTLASYGWIYIAAIYSLIQIGQGSAFHCLFVFAIGLLFGWTVKNTGSIIGVGLSHGLINIGLFLVFPHILPIS